ncbi:hypothetical protein HMPREF9371_0177 [Neisseria shayeganii 871]|uniref:Uncharacterized protein n=1 Tax=Neisseria shayeganii 871 TaxID=1032488 RepID=G4CEY8_9NEIS|nr:hypothetical protein HMPREF9371_0177 [Neisseria shayeganii 871]
MAEEVIPEQNAALKGSGQQRRGILAAAGVPVKNRGKKKPLPETTAADGFTERR